MRSPLLNDVSLAANELTEPDRLSSLLENRDLLEANDRFERDRRDSDLGEPCCGLISGLLYATCIARVDRKKIFIYDVTEKQIKKLTFFIDLFIGSNTEYYICSSNWCIPITKNQVN